MINIELINSFMSFLTFVLGLFIIIFMALKKDIIKARLFLSEEKIVKLFFLFVLSIEVFTLRELYDFFYSHTFTAELLETLSVLLVLIATILLYFVIFPKQKALRKKS
jgi:hypothetical protein